MMLKMVENTESKKRRIKEMRKKKDRGDDALCVDDDITSRVWE